MFLFVGCIKNKHKKVLALFKDAILHWNNKIKSIYQRPGICVKYFLSFPQKRMSPEKTETNYRISANIFRGNYSFLNSTLCSVTFGHSKYRCGNYSRVETIRGITVSVYFSISEWWNWPKHQFCQVPNGIFGIIVTGTKFFFTHMPGYNGNICTYFLIWK